MQAYSDYWEDEADEYIYGSDDEDNADVRKKPVPIVSTAKFDNYIIQVNLQFGHTYEEKDWHKFLDCKNIYSSNYSLI